MNATPKMLSFITILIPERIIPEDGPFADLLDEVAATGVVPAMAKAEAHKVITYLMDLPKADKARKPSVRVGVYDLPGVGLVKVRQIRGTRDKTTQQLDPRTRRYTDAPALMGALEPHMRLRASQAATWARSEGLCPWCTQVLQPARNPLQAMGPSCARKIV